MKKLLYIGLVKKGSRSYGDAIAYRVFFHYMASNHTDIDLHSRSYREIYDPRTRKGYGKKISDFDFIVLGGGSCVSNLNRPYADGLLTFIRKLGIPYGIFGAGVLFEKRRDQAGYVCKKTSHSKAVVAENCNGASHISVRDDASQKYLLGVAPDCGAKVLGDPGMMAPLAVNRADFKIDSKLPIIGINLAAGSDKCLGNFGMSQQILKKAIVEFIEKNKANYKFVFLPFNGSDEKYFPLMKQHGVKCYGYGVTQTCQVMQQCDFFIGVRVHADITAASFRVPFVSIMYTRPDENFLDHIKYPKECRIKSDELTGYEQIRKAFEYAIEHCYTDLWDDGSKNGMRLLPRYNTYLRRLKELCQAVKAS
jgi:hypothetical protein